MATNRTIEELTVKVKTEGTEKLKGLKSGLGELKKDAEGLSQVGGPLGNTLNGIIGKLGPLGLAASVVGGAFVALGSKAVSLADQLGDISKATGISAGALQSFKSSLIAAGGNLDTFEKLATKLSLTTGQASIGNAELQASFRKLGVFVRDASGEVRSTEDILRDTIDALNKIQSPAERAALASKLLGEEAAKLDFSNVKAIADVDFDKQVGALNKISDFMKEMVASAEKNTISFFGQLAYDIQTALDGSESLFKSIMRNRAATENYNNTGEFAGMGLDQTAGTGALAGLPMNRRGQGFVDPRIIKADGVGDFGAASPALLASRKKLEQSLADASLSVALRTTDEYKKIILQREADIAKAKLDIYAQQNIDKADLDKEFAAKSKEITAKAGTASYELDKRRSEQLKQFILQQAQLGQAYESQNREQQNAISDQTALLGLGEDEARLLQYKQSLLTKQRTTIEQLRNEQEKIKLTIGTDPDAAVKIQKLEETIKRVEQATGTAISTGESYIKTNQAITKSVDAMRFAQELSNSAQLDGIKTKFDLVNLTATENEKIINAIKLQKELAIATKIQQEQAKLGFGQSVTPEQQTKIRTEYEKTAAVQVTAAEETIAKSREFATGWESAFKQYSENASNAANQAKDIFSTVTKGFEDLIVNFVKTGKLNFKDFANSVIEQFIRIQAQQLVLGIVGGGGNAAGSFISSLLGRATGGAVNGSTPYLVGEQGPELFVPNTAGKIVPNGSVGGASVTYNINAVDASSFRQLVASDPEFIYAVTEKGRSSIPSRR